MNKKIIALIIVVFGLISGLQAGEISIKDSKELLSLVSTDKDFNDALDLLSASDNAEDLKKDKAILLQITELSKDHKADISEWGNRR